MANKPPMMGLDIETASSGFYDGFIKDVTITGKILIGALVVWAIAFPESSTSILGSVNNFILNNFGTWYIWTVAFFMIVCAFFAIWPRTGSLLLGNSDDKPEFSRFSWFSMMFGAGIGVGMLTFATAEPMYHFGNNPEVIQLLASH